VEHVETNAPSGRCVADAHRIARPGAVQPDQHHAQPNSGAPGSTTTVAACGFTSGSTVTITFDGTTIGTGVADAIGCVSITVTIQAASVDSHQISAVSTITVGATFNVTGAVQSLPTTGSSSTGLLTAAGAGLVGVGALATRRRRETASA